MMGWLVMAAGIDQGVFSNAIDIVEADALHTLYVHIYSYLK